MWLAASPTRTWLFRSSWEVLELILGLCSILDCSINYGREHILFSELKKKHFKESLHRKI